MKVSVNDIGLISYLITDDVIEKLIAVSEKAKFGKKSELVLDTSYRDTQMIPAKELEVDIDQKELDDVLLRMKEKLHLEEQSQLKIHLYNMLIYGPGQFFKIHRDTEKVPNMVATLVMVLPSPHKGGYLKIKHHDEKHKFFGLIRNDIIKCIAFYADCYHEVKKVEGYRVSLTYNVELISNPIQDLVPVEDNLKNALSSFFEKKENDVLLYYMDHQYTELSLRWHMLKGRDQICAKALLAVAKYEGYVPYLALADHHESWPEGKCRDEREKDVDLYYWINENNISEEFSSGSVSEDKICFLKDTYKFHPYKREEEEHKGNEPGTFEEWYHRSCVVLWRSPWSFYEGFTMELNALHQLTLQPGMETKLLEKLNGPSKHFFSATEFWGCLNHYKKIVDIMMYVNDKETTSKVLVNLEQSQVFDRRSTQEKLLPWIASNCDLETWKILVKAWKSSRGSKHLLEYLLEYLLKFLSKYMAGEDKDLEIAKYLLDEIAKCFLNQESSNESFSYLSYGSTHVMRSLLKISFQLGKTDVENDLMNNTDFEIPVTHFQIFEEELDPEQLKRISGKLILNMTNFVLDNMKEEYFYAIPKEADIETISSLLKICIKLENADVEQKIFDRLLSESGFTPLFLGKLLIQLERFLKDSYYTDFKSRALKIIQRELDTLNENSNDCSLAIQHSCKDEDVREYCEKVQNFLASKTDMQVVIECVYYYVTSHFYRYLDGKALPIELEICSGKFVVTKLPKLLQDRQNLIGHLMSCKNEIEQNTSAGTEGVEIHDAKKPKLM